MANIKPCAEKIFKWEGGFVDDPKDHGGATNMGVTIATWRKVGYDKDGDGDIDADDIRLLSREDAMYVMKLFYWDRWKADKINNQSIANILVDWVWASGKWGIIIPQRILGVMDDGMVGPVTLRAVNSVDQRWLWNNVFASRMKFIEDIVERDPSQQRFLIGWMNRLNDFTFQY